MNHDTYINQIGRNLFCCSVDFPKKITLQKLPDINGIGEELLFHALEKLHNYYQELYRSLGEIDPVMLGAPDFQNSHPVDKSNFDKCVEKVLKILLVLYAIGFTGEYTSNGFITVNKQSLQDLCKKLKVSALDSIFEKLNIFGVGISEYDDGNLKAWFINDNEGLIAKYHCFYTKYMCKNKPDDSKLITGYFRNDFNSLFDIKLKKQIEREEKCITSMLSQDKADMLNEIFRVLKEEMDCRAEIKIPVYKGILKGAFSAAYKNRKTGRTLVSLDTEAGEIVIRLNFITQTLGKVFQAANEFPAEVFDNIKNCYCRGNECMGHDGVYITEAGMCFCSHIIKYELRELERRTFTDFIRLLRLQYRLLMEVYDTIK